MALKFDRAELRDLTLYVKAEALRLGFSRAGITTPEPPPHLEIYEKWLKEGRHGEMTYLETDRARQRRADPRRILPECASILVVAANYLPIGQKSKSVAAYAVGDDYHDVLTDRLKELVKRH